MPEQAEGHGIGSKLVAAALADVRRRGLKVVPQCPFVAAYLERRPEAAELAYRAWPISFSDSGEEQSRPPGTRQTSLPCAS